MEFIKMHGIGNDYVFVDCFRQEAPADPARAAIAVSKPHVGVGADGLILMLPDAECDARMRIFNADGSEGEMCGNGIRCMSLPRAARPWARAWTWARRSSIRRKFP